MKAIMYHYVREYKPELPKFRFLDIRTSESNLTILIKNMVLSQERLGFSN